MDNTLLLRLRPKLEVILKETDFEVIDSSDPKNEGIYPYNTIESIEFKKERINWVVTVANSIFGVLMDVGTFEKYKDKAYLQVILKDKTLKIWLIKTNMAKAEMLKSELAKKINSSPPTSQNIETNRPL